jgi:hypothetical protein
VDRLDGGPWDSKGEFKCRVCGWNNWVGVSAAYGHLKSKHGGGGVHRLVPSGEGGQAEEEGGRKARKAQLDKADKVRAGMV